MVNRVVRYADLRNQVPCTNPGERILDVCKLQFNEDGTEELVVVDHIDTYQMIQSHANSCDIHRIVERCTITGDTSELYKREGFFGDLVGMPKSRAEAIQMINDANNVWAQLPIDIKEKFDNDSNKFLATAFTEEWYKKLEIPEVKDIEKVEENKVDE